MSYRAEVNGRLFLDTTLDDDDYTLISANVQLLKGQAGAFVFNVPVCNAEYNSFHRLTSYVDLYRDDELLFFGRVYSINRLFDNSLDIICEGMLTVLSDTIFDPIIYDDTVHGLVNALITSHNAQVEEAKQIQVGTLYVSDAACYRAYENYETTWKRLSDLADSYGGFFKLRRTNGAMYLDWYDHCTDGSSQAVDFGENLLDLSNYHNASNVVTVLTPLGAADSENVRLDISSVNQGSKELTASQEYINQYGYVHKTQIWDDVTVPSILAAKGLQYMQACLQPQYTINVTAVDMADAGYNIDHFSVGQRLKITSAPHRIDGVWFDVNSQTLDLFRPQNNRLTLGTELISYAQARKADANAIRNAVEKIAALYTPRSALDDAINQATSLITGNSGGYIILHDSDNDGEPDELLVMDTPDINTAVKIWRFNNAGLGYSSTGYDGVYGLAMTMDGAIVADRITTGTLNGNLLKAGVIRGQNGNSYWDLNTGVLHIEGSGDIDKSKTFIYEPVPPYYVGDLWCTQRSETSGVVGYAIVDYAIAGDESSGEGGKIMVCIYTRTSGTFNPDDWTLITNYVDDSDIQIIQQRLNTAELNIASNAAEIQLKASTEIVDGLGNRLATAETTITQNSHDIELKVSESDITGNYLVSKINLNSTTATIAASHIDLQGAVTFTSFDSTTKSQVVIGATSRNQYYLSTSSSSLSGGSWSNSVNWISGRYIWTRIATVKTYADNTTSTSYSDAIYDSNLTSALSTATTANTTANGAVGATVSCYYRSTSSTTPSISTSTSIGTSDTTDNAWEYVLPRPKNGCYFFTCERYAYRDGTVGFSTVRQMSNLTYSSLWCSANNASYIDGGHIYTSSITATQIASGAITTDKLAANSVTAAKISVSDLQAIGATIGGFVIDSNSIHTNGIVITSNDTNSVGLSSSTFTRTINGTSRSNLKFAIGGNFGVSNTGALYAGSAVIGGSITSTATGTITYISNGTIEIDKWSGGSGNSLWLREQTGSSFNRNAETDPYSCTVKPSAVIINNKSTSSNSGWYQLYLDPKAVGIYKYSSDSWPVGFNVTSRSDSRAVLFSEYITYTYSISQVSDRRRKEDITPIAPQEAIQRVLNWNPVRYKFLDQDGYHHGFIAQNIEATKNDDAWEVVTEDISTGYKSLAYTELLADLVATVQHMHSEIERLKGV